MSSDMGPDGGQTRDEASALAIVMASASSTMGQAPLEVSFMGSAMGGQAPYKFVWDFGDESVVVNGVQVKHTYVSDGIFIAKLTVTDAAGASDTRDITIKLNNLAGPIITQIVATPTFGQAPLVVNFQAMVANINEDIDYAWDFGDGNGSTNKSPTHTYQSSGSFTATLMIKDRATNQTSPSVATSIQVASDAEPATSIDATPQVGVVPLKVSFKGAVIGGNTPYRYSWDFGDGSTPALVQNPNHTYTKAGIYSALFTVTDADGDKNTSMVSITAQANSIPVVDITAVPATGEAPLSVKFDPQVQGGEQPLSYDWRLGDGAISTEVSPEHVYQTAGDYIAMVTVTDANGDSVSDMINVMVTSNIPTVTLSATPVIGPAPLQTQLSAVGRGGDGALTYKWFFGDGTAPATGAMTTHTYLNPGVYEATVVVTDVDGDTSDDRITINALDMAPDLKVETFTITTSGVDATYEVVIKNVGVANATSNFAVRFYDDLAQAPDVMTPTSTSHTVSTVIPPQGVHTVTITRPNRPFGTYKGWVFVDPLDANQDLDRSNNIGGANPYDIDGFVINEVFYDAIGADVGTFVELYGRPGKDVSGYVLAEIDGSNGVADSFTIPANTTIPLDGYLVIGDGTTANEDIDSGNWSDFENGAESLVLKDANGTIVDAMGWGDHSATSHFSGEGNPTTDVMSGYSLGRDSLSKDTDDNLNDFYIWNIPTPGEVNLAKMTNNADTCADAYLISNNQSGKFIVESNLFGTTNDYTRLDTSGPDCGSTNSMLGGADQVLSFVVPPNRTASVTLEFSDRAPVDLDAVFTKDPCASLNTGLIGCNFVGINTYSNLGPGTYYIVVLEDSTTSSMFMSAPYVYKVDLTFSN